MAELTKAVLTTPEVTKTKWTDETYAELPFKILRRTVFKVSNIKNQQFASHVQYNLLLADQIIKVFVDFRKGTVSVVYSDKDMPKEALEEYITNGFKSWDLVTKHEILEVTDDDENYEYTKIVDLHYNLEAEEEEEDVSTFNHMGAGGLED